MPRSHHGDPGSSSNSSRQQVLRAADIEESAPLLASPSTELERTKRHSNDSLDLYFSDTENHESSNRFDNPGVLYHSSDESYFLDLIMEKVKATKFAHFVDKLAVESEPGLTNAQLMLNNHDLKPGMLFKQMPSKLGLTILQSKQNVVNGDRGIL